MRILLHHLEGPGISKVESHPKAVLPPVIIYTRDSEFVLLKILKELFT